MPINQDDIDQVVQELLVEEQGEGGQPPAVTPPAEEPPAAPAEPAAAAPPAEEPPAEPPAEDPPGEPAVNREQLKQQAIGFLARQSGKSVEEIQAALDGGQPAEDPPVEPTDPLAELKQRIAGVELPEEYQHLDLEDQLMMKAAKAAGDMAGENAEQMIEQRMAPIEGMMRQAQFAQALDQFAGSLAEEHGIAGERQAIAEKVGKLGPGVIEAYMKGDELAAQMVDDAVKVIKFESKTAAEQAAAQPLPNIDPVGGDVEGAAGFSASEQSFADGLARLFAQEGEEFDSANFVKGARNRN